jgi:hypothetical protein
MGAVKAASRRPDAGLSDLAQDPPPILHQRHEKRVRRLCTHSRRDPERGGLVSSFFTRERSQVRNPPRPLRRAHWTVQVRSSRRGATGRVGAWAGRFPARAATSLLRRVRGSCGSTALEHRRSPGCRRPGCDGDRTATRPRSLRASAGGPEGPPCRLPERGSGATSRKRRRRAAIVGPVIKPTRLRRVFFPDKPKR